MKEIVKAAEMVNAHESAARCEEDDKVIFSKLDEWGVTYIEWPPEEVAKVTKVSLEILDETARDIGAKDPRVATGIGIVKDFMREKGYMD